MILLMPMAQTPAGAGAAATNGSRKPTVAAPASASPELTARPHRRIFTAQDKLRIPADTDRAADTGGIAAILRRGGLCSSALTDWRRQRDAGALGAPTPAKCGPKVAEPNPLTAEVALLQEDVRLALRLKRAEAVMEVQENPRNELGPGARLWLWKRKAVCLAVGERPTTSWWTWSRYQATSGTHPPCCLKTLKTECY